MRVAARLTGGAAGLAAAALLSEVRVRRDGNITDCWRRIAVEPRGETVLGISFRPLQAEAMGLDADRALRVLLDHRFGLVRLAAHWSRIEPHPRHWSTDELDRHLDAAEQAGKQVILGVGAIKNFGYPELFVPAHRLGRPLPEGRLIQPETHPSLLAAAQEFVARIADRYRDRASIVAWQVEHEAVDPLGMEHSWRLSTELVRREVEAVRAADPRHRPILLNAYLPSSLAVAGQQRWRTRDQGDSLSLALRLADIVGLDIYPRHALLGVEGAALYLDGSNSPWGPRRRLKQVARALGEGQRLMVTEGQAEPWEAVTIPPARPGRQAYSCPPDAVIGNYNRCLSWARSSGAALDAYLFWGAEYWLRRARDGDREYLYAFQRVLDQA